MIDIKKLAPGMTVYSVSSQKAGNTSIKTIAIHPVFVKEVHDTYVLASWNGNTARKFFAKGGKLPWRKDKPVTVTVHGICRLATKQEKEAILAAKKEKHA